MKIKTFAYGIVVISAVTLLGRAAYYGSWVSNVTATVTYPILRLNRRWIEPFKKQLYAAEKPADIQSLQRQNQLLQLQNVRLRAALAYAENIKELHAFNERYRQQGSIAQIVARYITPESHYFLVDAGSQKGIAKDMVVLYENNLIGKITEVYPSWSKACLVTDRNCKVAAYCAQTKAHGIYEGINDQSNAALNFVNHLSEVEPGDLVLSSGEGLVFPEGFALGKVASYENDGLYKQVKIEPLCNIRDIDYCLIMAKQ